MFEKIPLVTYKPSMKITRKTSWQTKTRPVHLYSGLRDRPWDKFISIYLCTYLLLFYSNQDKLLIPFELHLDNALLPVQAAIIYLLFVRSVALNSPLASVHPAHDVF